MARGRPKTGSADGCAFNITCVTRLGRESQLISLLFCDVSISLQEANRWLTTRTFSINRGHCVGPRAAALIRFSSSKTHAWVVGRSRISYPQRHVCAMYTFVYLQRMECLSEMALINSGKSKSTLICKRTIRSSGIVGERTFHYETLHGSNQN